MRIREFVKHILLVFLFSCFLVLFLLLRAMSTTVDLTSEYHARRRCIDIACLVSRSFCNTMIPSTPLTSVPGLLYRRDFKGKTVVASKNDYIKIKRTRSGTAIRAESRNPLTSSCLQLPPSLILLNFMLTEAFESFQQRRWRIFREHRFVHHRTIFDHGNCPWQHQLLVLLDRFIETTNAKLDDLLREL